MIWDISPELTPESAVWPGDVPLSRDVALDMKSGANLTLSSIRTTLHVGAHADAPSHYRVDGDSIDRRPLELYMGPCEVMSVEVERGERIRALPRPPGAERLLLKTQTAPDPNEFNTDFAALSAELIRSLAEAGVRLVGIDTPSVDLFDDRELEAHNEIARNDMAILEGLVLADVPDGLYELVALPLKIRGGDASPVRAVLTRR